MEQYCHQCRLSDQDESIIRDCFGKLENIINVSIEQQEDQLRQMNVFICYNNYNSPRLKLFKGLSCQNFSKDLNTKFSQFLFDKAQSIEMAIRKIVQTDQLLIENYKESQLSQNNDKSFSLSYEYSEYCNNQQPDYSQCQQCEASKKKFDEFTSELESLRSNFKELQAAYQESNNQKVLLTKRLNKLKTDQSDTKLIDNSEMNSENYLLKEELEQAYKALEHAQLQNQEFENELQNRDMYLDKAQEIIKRLYQECEILQNQQDDGKEWNNQEKLDKVKGQKKQYKTQVQQLEWKLKEQIDKISKEKPGDFEDKKTIKDHLELVAKQIAKKPLNYTHYKYKAETITIIHVLNQIIQENWEFQQQQKEIFQNLTQLQSKEFYYQQLEQELNDLSYQNQELLNITNECKNLIEFYNEREQYLCGLVKDSIKAQQSISDQFRYYTKGVEEVNSKLFTNQNLQLITQSLSSQRQNDRIEQYEIEIQSLMQGQVERDKVIQQLQLKLDNYQAEFNNSTHSLQSQFELQSSQIQQKNKELADELYQFQKQNTSLEKLANQKIQLLKELKQLNKSKNETIAEINSMRNYQQSPQSFKHLIQKKDNKIKYLDDQNKELQNALQRCQQDFARTVNRYNYQIENYEKVLDERNKINSRLMLKFSDSYEENQFSQTQQLGANRKQQCQCDKIINIIKEFLNGLIYGKQEICDKVIENYLQILQNEQQVSLNKLFSWVYNKIPSLNQIQQIFEEILNIMNPNNDTPPKQSILEFLTYISRIIEYYLRAPSNTQMTLTPSQLKKYHFNIERLEKSRRIMEQREDSLNHVLKKVSELQGSVKSTNNLKPELMRQIMDMFHRFFNTFISDFQNDRKRCYEITEDFKSIVKPLRRYRNQSADVH